MQTGWMKKLMLAAMAAAFALCAAGCLFQPVEELYALPVLPGEYSDLQETIQTTMNDLGAEYATISSGDNTSTVQLLDLDSDGQQETAAVFLRVTSAVEKPMRICLYRRNTDKEYRQIHMLEGDGSSINSIAYEDLNGDGIKELIVSWQMSGRVYILSAYQLNPEGAAELVSTTYNEGYMTADLDGVGGKELLVFQQNSSGENGNRAEYYSYRDGAMMMAASVQLSDNIVDIQSAQMSRLADGSRGIYVTGVIGNGVLTDILTLTPEGLKNITREVETGISSSTVRTYTDVAAADINGDGVLEIPLPVQTVATDSTALSSCYIIYWRQFDQTGTPAVSCATYHSTSDGWYFMIPSDWLGKITVARNDVMSNRGERSVVFFYLAESGETGEDGEPLREPIPFMSIYRLTGSNRVARARMPGRFVIREDVTTIYAGLFHSDSWDSGISKEEIAQRFNLITTEWSAQ